MRILLTGNGFDLSHNLPTKYSNFMNVITFLNAFEKEIDSFATVSDIFGNEYFIYCDKFIFDCNDKYKLAYQEAKIDRLELSKYLNLSKTNVWIKYLKKIFSNSKENWIDFEREISNVINCLKYVFKNCDENTDLSRDLRDANVIYTILQFDDLIDINSYEQHTIKKTYLHKANKYAMTEINSKKIVSVLYKDLLELMEILKFYLRCFIENPLEIILSKNLINNNDAIRNITTAITFNYTNTLEKLYGISRVFHIHGDINNNIVLGINPNEDDNIESIDTLFLCFKKYYQRVFNETDLGYINRINTIKSEINRLGMIDLLVIGHSLDITDKDILMELFDISHRITIKYHKKEVVASYIENLVTMYGKEGFDRLRTKKHLRFEQL